MGTFLSLSKSTTVVWLDVSEWALLGFGAVLVAGLIMEYRFEHDSRWIKFGAILVIIGVAGELLADGGIFLFSNHLQTISDAEIATLNARASKDEKEAARLQKEAEDERLARVQLEKSMDWRHLSEGARKSLCEILPPQTVDDETVVVTFWSDPEPALYADEFAEAIGSCRPLPVPVGSGTHPHQAPKLALPQWTFPLRFGVSLEFPSKDARIATSLLYALRDNDVDARIPSVKERQVPKASNRLIIIGPRAYPNSPERTRSSSK